MVSNRLVESSRHRLLQGVEVDEGTGGPPLISAIRSRGHENPFRFLEHTVGFLAPSGTNTASLGKPGESALDHSAPGWILLVLWNGLRFGFIAPPSMFDVRCVVGIEDNLEDILIVIPFVGTQALLAAWLSLRPFSGASF